MTKLIVAAVLCLAIAGQALAQERVFAQQGCVERVPRSPADLKAVAQTTTIDVAWNSPAGDACVDTYDYVVYEKVKGRPRSTGLTKVREYSITVTGLKPDTEYVVEVTSVNSMKGSSAPATTTVRTKKACDKAAKPGTINPVFMNQASTSTLLLSWLPPAGTACVDGYYKFQITPRNNRKDGATTRVTYTMKSAFKVVASGSIPAGRKTL
ncbi:MAG: fibronectin type III [Monoraphidium minutum]|nr:MAG: fibronectin type III [Monoraphidium minutum]